MEVQDLAVATQQEDEVGAGGGVEQDVVVVPPAAAQPPLGAAPGMVGALTVVIALEGQWRGAAEAVVGLPLDFAALAGEDRVGDAQVGRLDRRRWRTDGGTRKLGQAAGAAATGGW